MKLVKTAIVGDTFLKLFLGFRIATISGRFGGGKTLLGVALAYWLLGGRYVDQIVSNIPIEFAKDNPDLLYRTAIILDESWMYISSRQDVLNYSAYLRKLDSYLILPSVFPVHYRLSFFTSERIINFQGLGLPIWYYRWSLTMSSRARDKGSFYLTNPAVMYGRYDTKYIPFDDAGISNLLKETIHDNLKKSGRSIHTPIFNNSGFIDNGNNSSIEDMEDTISQLSETFTIEAEETIGKIRKAVKRR